MPITNQAPAISVVMPVHNALPFLDEAVKSILDQSRPDFEFVIYDDASTDGSTQRLQEWARQDARIRLFRGESRLGPAASSNAVVRLAKAPLVARMDADDVSRPERLELQAEVLEANPDVGIVASLCEVIGSDGQLLRGPDYTGLTRRSLSRPFPHGSIMFRRDLFEPLGGYRDECEFWEDLDFVVRASEKARILVVPRPLYAWRHSSAGTRLASDQTRVENAIDLRYRAIARIRQNRSYDDLLRGGQRKDGDRVDPRVFVSIGSLALWAGERPKLLRRLLRRGRLRFDAATIIALGWVCWASISPATLRGVVAFPSRLRNAAASTKPPMKEPVEWLTPQKRRPSPNRKKKAGD